MEKNPSCSNSFNSFHFNSFAVSIDFQIFLPCYDFREDGGVDFFRLSSRGGNEDGKMCTGFKLS